MRTTNIPTLILSIISIIYLIIFKEFINPKIKRKLKLEFPSELLLVSSFLLFFLILSFYNIINQDNDFSYTVIFYFEGLFKSELN